MRVYVAGPMRGIPHFNYPAFHNATKKLREQGHEVFSPAERDIERDGVDWGSAHPDGDLQAAISNGLSLRQALGDDLAYVCREAEAIALLPGWQNSKGAKAELATAEALGLWVIHL